MGMFPLRRSMEIHKEIRTLFIGVDDEWWGTTRIERLALTFEHHDYVTAGWRLTKAEAFELLDPGPIGESGVEVPKSHWPTRSVDSWTDEQMDGREPHWLRNYVARFWPEDVA